MKIIKSIPKNDGFYMPAEFSPHYGCIMIWPERGDSWQYGGYEARKAFIKAAEIIAKSEKLTVLASEAQYNNARAVLAENIRVVELSTDDSWARDTAPTFVTNGKTIRGIDWNFNAWEVLLTDFIFLGSVTASLQESFVTSTTLMYTMREILSLRVALFIQTALVLFLQLKNVF